MTKLILVKLYYIQIITTHTIEGWENDLKHFRGIC